MTPCAPKACACPQAKRCARRSMAGSPVDYSVSLRTGRWCPVFIDKRWTETMGIGRPLSDIAQRTLRMIIDAGAQGVSCRQIREAFPDNQETARKSALNGVHLGRLWNLRSRRLTVYYAHGVDPDAAAETFAARVAERDAGQASLAQARAARNRLRLAALAEGRRDARAALESEREARRLAAQKAHEEREAQRIERERDKRTRAAIKREETSLNNRLARRIRGTTCGIVPPAQSAPVAVDWSRAVVTVAPRKLGRYEVLETPGEFAAMKPGQYGFEAQSCAARAAQC